MTIEEFLRARLEEDAQRVDRAKAHGYPAEPYPYEQLVADIRAKARILGNYRWVKGQKDKVPSLPIDQSLGALKEVLHHMAQVYSSHPDYDPMWKL
ncbi:hypothetical protein CDO52_00250 [Nocardiopsis gilva YIM 90087]|uniref:Uncharacterized protein n=1 Tax=Nocardiopsis gilva YIM 90087 TaxID=1235441 RepID=A0A223RZZ1_9ACTN|nr:DUF6221 family protein [Nocardiopsis gilva]ASU81418.1 hypothetical protein CDO52_00250 [Nocardiopsis gilva YIM 90087]